MLKPGIDIAVGILVQGVGSMPHQGGALIISLDFELFWGLRDVTNLKSYAARLETARQNIPSILNLFTRYGIHATWATVGFLMARDKEELMTHVPALLPSYVNPRLSPYGEYMAGVGADEAEDMYHYAGSLVELIKNTPFQEVGSHTFCHYYCRAPGQTTGEFSLDLQAARDLAEQWGIQLRSLVLPRNQISTDHLHAAELLGFLSYRGNPNSWLYTRKGRMGRIMRIADSYLNLSGYNCFAVPKDQPGLLNLPASMFMRPVGRSRLLRYLALRRIKHAMYYAARQGLAYHLWWHPHNFGAAPQENLEFLERILLEYTNLKECTGMVSMSMHEACNMATKRELVP